MFDFNGGYTPSYAAVPTGPVVASHTTALRGGRLCVLPGWPASGGTLEITIAPAPGHSVAFDAFEWEYEGTESPTINHIRLSSSIDGHVATLFERTEVPGPGFIGDVSAVLTSVAALQSVTVPVTFRIALSQVGGWNSPDHYEIDEIDIRGSDTPPGGCQSPTTASTDHYGTSVPGCFGPPTVALDAPPIIGTTPSILATAGNVPLTEPDAVAALMIGFAPANLPFLGGTFLVDPALTIDIVISPVTGYALEFPIGNECGFVGLQVYCQVICLDACTSAGLSFSDGLRMVVGAV